MNNEDSHTQLQLYMTSVMIHSKNYICTINEVFLPQEINK